MQPPTTLTVVLLCGVLLGADAEPEAPTVVSRSPYAFLKKASPQTQQEYLKLATDRHLSREKLRKLKDELIEKESLEVQKLYEEQKMFEKDRKMKQNEGHLLNVARSTDPKWSSFIDKAHKVFNDETLSVNEVCEKLVLLKYKSGLEVKERYLNVYNCAPNLLL